MLQVLQKSEICKLFVQVGERQSGSLQQHQPDGGLSQQLHQGDEDNGR